MSACPKVILLTLFIVLTIVTPSPPNEDYIVITRQELRMGKQDKRGVRNCGSGCTKIKMYIYIVFIYI